MGFGPTDRQKETVLIEVAVSLARVLTRSGNRVGAILYNNAVERTIPPRNGRRQVLRLAHELLRPAAESHGSTDLKRLIEAGASVDRRRSLVFVISDFISEPGWERAMSRLTERHEVIAIRLVDPRELELPDAGWIVVEDVETGELLSVDTSDPEFRRRFGEVAEARGSEVHELAKQAGTPLYDSLHRGRPGARARAHGGEPQEAEALMSFISPDMLVLLVLVPLGRLRVHAHRQEPHGPGLGTRRDGFAPTSGAGRLRKVRHVPAVFFLTALAAIVVACARPQMKVGLPHREGTVILAFDISNSMQATDLQPTRMDAAKAAAKEFIDEQPSTIKIGIVAFNNGALITQQPTNDKSQVTAAIDRLTPTGATSLGQGIFASLSAIAGKPLSLPEDASPDDLANVDIGYYGSAAIVLLSDGENTSGPDAEGGRPTGIDGRRAHLPDRDRQHGGHRPADRRLQRGDGARRAVDEADRLGHQRRVLQRQGLGDADTDLPEHRPADRHRPEGDRGDRTVRRCQHGPVPRRRSHVDAVVREVGVAMSFASPLALLGLLIVPLLLGGYLWQLRRKRKNAVRYSSVALIRHGDPQAIALASPRPDCSLPRRHRRAVDRVARPRISHDISINKTSIILTLDVSGSMCATDVTPNRLTAAQNAAKAVRQEPGCRHADRDHRVLPTSPSWSCHRRPTKVC